MSVVTSSSTSGESTREGTCDSTGGNTRWKDWTMSSRSPRLGEVWFSTVVSANTLGRAGGKMDGRNGGSEESILCLFQPLSVSLCLSVSLSACLSICLSLSVSLCLSLSLSFIYLSVCLSLTLSLSLSLSLYLSLPVCLSLSVCLSVCLFFSLSVSLCLSGYLSISVSVSVCLSVCLSLTLSLSLCLCLSLSLLSLLPPLSLSLTPCFPFSYLFSRKSSIIRPRLYASLIPGRAGISNDTSQTAL